MQVLRNELFRPWFVGSDQWGVEIIDGEFSGVTIQFEKFTFSEKDDSSVDLDYHIINKPEDMGDPEKSEVFAQTLELIVNDILREALNEVKNDQA
jgi:hypothetical protein